VPSPFVEQVLLEEIAAGGFSRRSFTPDEIMARILKVMRTEGGQSLLRALPKVPLTSTLS
jgi:hypothetical protein